MNFFYLTYGPHIFFFLPGPSFEPGILIFTGKDFLALDHSAIWARYDHSMGMTLVCFGLLVRFPKVRILYSYRIIKIVIFFSPVTTTAKTCGEKCLNSSSCL